MKRIFAALAFLLLWNSPASSDDFSWAYNSTGVPSYSSPAAACQAYIDLRPVDWQAKYVSVTPHTEKQWTCTYTHKRYSSEQQTTTPIYRVGTGCSTGEYDPSTGECTAPEEDKCASTEGKTIDHEFNRGPIDNPSVRNPPPPEVCQNECQYTATDIVRTCKRFNEGENLSDVFCVVAYEGNGQSCTAGNPSPGSVFDQPPSKPPTKSDPTFAKDSKCNDWETQPDGTQTRSCSSTSESKHPGKVDCSGDSCKAGVPPPDYSKTDVKQDIEKKTNPDGSTSTKTDTTTDKTSCKGVKPCTSTSKTETTTDEEGADGEPGDSGYQCTGSGCAEEEGDEEEESSSVSGESCDAAIACEGDAIQCAILRQQKESRCALDEAMNYEDNKSKIDQLVQGEEYQLEEETFQIPSFATGAVRFLPSNGCPAPSRASLSNGRSLQFEYEPFCTFAEGISPVVVACALLFAALYVGRGLGGS
ncbi:virulence factor TspB C-terminal domain-related protein [Stutzerimonas nitrititolerans]|uniref:virulence factor TspB C-terminal domain-related protein n=1 Tax=Stutzerimonas nitrititolerans TaxID=2482751 RepID=UPI00289CB6FA|nr:virulence factor TspB C-terminal domain-related protein [Stutzerimonas nitrititolerans]